jgi:single-stranded-DNA-specific exonuclease
MPSKRWLIPPPLSPQADLALSVFPPLLRQVLFNRGYASAAEASLFLAAQPGFDPDPYQLTGLGTAVERIQSAVQRGEPVAIYGDYDVDGVTATALLVQTLQALGGRVRGYIPNRFDEGYGLNVEALEALHAEGVRLVVTVDCGIRSPAEAAHARAIGLDLIITDHHHPGEELPRALAVVDPKQPDDGYPDKDLAGVGVAYKLAQALLAGGPAGGPASLTPEALLDLVALGTVADLAPLTGENRGLVRRGLGAMRQTTRQGLYSLANLAGLDLQGLNAGHIGFVLGPRLNAAGRLDSALAAFELLTTGDVFRAGQLAQQLEIQNRERQALTRQTQEQAGTLALAQDPEACLLFAAHPDFNPGVVGLAAARLAESHYRPAVVAAVDQETTRGSCRSIPEFHITDALDQCADLLVRHGGHAAAAGFTVRNENLPELVRRLKDIARAELSGLDLRPTRTADAEVPLSDLKPELLVDLEYLEPTGYGNRGAVFVSRDLKVTSARAVGADSRHLKLAVTDGRVTFDAIAFRQGNWVTEKKMPSRVDLLYSFEINEYNGKKTLQLNVQDLKPAGTPDEGKIHPPG